jgi:hypothetical protein
MTMNAHRPGSIGSFYMAAVFTMLILSGVWFLRVSSSAEPNATVFLREDFDSLKEWKPLKFKKIRNMGTYTLDLQEDGACYVMAQSSDSASGMVWKGEFNVYEYPMIRWRWKVSNVYVKGNALQKEGDDYPLRIDVMFKYDTDDAHIKKSFKYDLGKFLYGQYPPYAGLNYIWANRRHDQQFIPSPYFKEVMMIPLRSGSELTGQWLEEERNILSDYRKAFGQDPPAIAGIAFMNDSDNTGEASVSWIDWIEIYRERE